MSREFNAEGHKTKGSTMKTGFLRKYSLTLLFLLISSLATVSMAQETPDEQTYIEQVKAFPETFTMSDSNSAEAWGRAQSFVALYSALKLHIVTDYVIQTNDPAKDDMSFGYNIVRTPLQGSFQITVSVFSRVRNPNSDLTAHILAYYIKTGSLPYPDLINR